MTNQLETQLSDARLTSRVVLAEDLRVGDTIEVWWQPRRDTITALRPYSGPIDCFRGAMVAEFALLRSGMTIEPGSKYQRIATCSAAQLEET